MNFLYPNFLWAISLIAIPIAIHLFNFRKYKKVYFSDISLLKNVNTQTKKQSKLKHILVLISRILALTCLVITFSYPYKSFQNKSDFNQKFVGIYLDNSLSMENENQNGIFIEQAKEKAVEIVNQYPSD
ncbi:MAG: BatA domain-containing protein, partial [Bacteroidota bacterium]|nr:BatA domain-containing protein [Bacteroidota bacterium]